jgi:NTE family protein
MALVAGGCASYPVNQSLDQYSLDKGYRARHMEVPDSSDKLLLVLTFSGGGTRAAAFSYGVLAELAKTTVTIDGHKRRLLDEVDTISSVSGGSFTSAYYGLFGDRIFHDFESRFLKVNIQGGLLARKFLFIPNWFRLMSPSFDSSDMAAEYYDKHVFDGGTFSDIAARKGPAIMINATDMTEGTPFSFTQGMFDLICSDISDVPVARAAAASSAVPVLLSPISLRNYAGTCGYPSEWIDEYLTEHDYLSRQYQLAFHADNYMDPEKKRYVHLVDGGVADNLGIRVILNKVLSRENAWNSLKLSKLENTHKIVFVVVDAETAIDRSEDLKKGPPGLFGVLSAVTSTPLQRFNIDTLELLHHNFAEWTEQIRSGRCNDPEFTGDRDRCGDIEFHLVYVRFGALKDKKEREYFQGLPTSFKLPDETVDKLRDVAGRLLRESEEYQQLLGDLK